MEFSHVAISLPWKLGYTAVGYALASSFFLTNKKEAKTLKGQNLAFSIHVKGE